MFFFNKTFTISMKNGFILVLAITFDKKKEQVLWKEKKQT